MSTDFAVELPARPFAAAWLNVSRAAAEADDRPQLHRAVIVELIDNRAVRLISTDSYMLLRSSVRNTLPDGYFDTVEDDEAAQRSVTAIDEDHRARALLKYAWKDAKEDLSATIILSVESLERDEAPTLMPSLAKLGLSISYGAERLVLPLFDSEPLNWRPLAVGRESCPTDSVAFTPEFLARLDGLYTCGETTNTATFGLAGPIGAAAISVDVVPDLSGILMPVRVDA